MNSLRIQTQEPVRPVHKSMMRAMLILASVLIVTVSPSFAQGTAFTYQGRLSDNGTPANGSSFLSFALFGDATGGSTIPGGGPLYRTVNVNNGLFTEVLDFGSTPNPFNGQTLWLEIGVSSTGNPGTYSPLSPRQQITPTPYALFAESVGGASGGILTLPYNSGPVSRPDSLFTLNNSGTGPAATFLGSVGIGMATPAYKLDVAGEVNAANGFIAGSAYSGSFGTVLSVPYYSRKRLLSSYWSGDVGDYVDLEVPGGDGPGNRVRITSRGNVGIGTTTPLEKLHVAGTYLRVDGAGDEQAYIGGDGVAQDVQVGSLNSSVGRVSLYNPNRTAGGGRMSLDVLDVLAYGNITAYGNVGIGTTTPGGKLHVLGNSAPGASIPTDTSVLASGDGFNNRFMSVYGNKAVYLSMWHGGNGNGELSTYDYTTGTGLPLVLNANGGTVSVPVLEIRGGADLAEPFQMSSSDIPKGAVVVIDDENPGKLKMSQNAYDTRVAGIVSGANGIKPGISLHQEGALDGGETVALSGRVYALADASYAPIKPGDLLTTSATPGHCMKATDLAKGQGAIIGKAMSALKEGKGMVLVLVSLQ